MKYKVMASVSGGAASYISAKLTLEIFGHEGTALVMADTMMEDEDLYRFVGDIQGRLNHQIIRIADGRDPWQVFEDEGMMGNTRADPCSRILKRELLASWRKENCEPDATITIGYDANEEHRLKINRAIMAPLIVRAPLIERGIWKEDIKRMVRAEGLKLSRMYDLGFAHDNCGGFCIKAGHGSFALLLENFPGRYAYHEGKEQAFRDKTGKDVSILRDRRGGKTHTFTLRQLRERHERQPSLIDRDDLGGCNCTGGAA